MKVSHSEGGAFGNTLLPEPNRVADQITQDCSSGLTGLPNYITGILDTPAAHGSLGGPRALRAHAPVIDAMSGAYSGVQKHHIRPRAQ